MNPFEQRKLVVFIHGGSNIDDESVHMTRRAFREHGFELEDLCLQSEGAKAKLESLLERRAEIAFFLSSNFWALNIRNGNELLHTVTGIPMVVLIHDHPVYFLHQLDPHLKDVILFAPGRDTADFMRKHYPFASTIIENPTHVDRSDSMGAPSIEQFRNRQNALLWAMNLVIFEMTIDDAWAQIKNLPSRRRVRAISTIEEAATECFVPLHQIWERKGSTVSGESPDIGDLRLVLNFIKLWRRTWLLRKLIDLPILVSSRYIPADIAWKYPKQLTYLTMSQTLPLYARYRFVVNCTPMLTYSLHDRLTEGLRNNAACITDQNNLIRNHFRDGHEMLFIDYRNGKIAEKIQTYLDDPDRAFALTEKAYIARRGYDRSSNAYKNLIDEVGEVWARKAQGYKNSTDSIIQPR